MNEHEIDSTAAELARRLTRDEAPPHAGGAHAATEDAVMSALERGERFGLPEPVRGIVNAIVAEAKTRHGANVCAATGCPSRGVTW